MTELSTRAYALLFEWRSGMDVQVDRNYHAAVSELCKLGLAAGAEPVTGLTLAGMKFVDQLKAVPLPPPTKSEALVLAERTLAALDSSIQKWRRILLGDGMDSGSVDCALCQEFLTKKGSCDGCPVSTAAGCSMCRNTPYAGWTDHHATAHHDSYGTKRCICDVCKQIALDEYTFLCGLRPGVEQTLKDAGGGCG